MDRRFINVCQFKMLTDHTVFFGKIAARFKGGFGPDLCNNSVNYFLLYFQHYAATSSLFNSHTDCSASTSSVIVGSVPHTGQVSCFTSLIFLNDMFFASKVSNSFVRSSPAPVINFKASAAWIVPSIPAIAPRTPAWAQEGTASGGGGFLKEQR